MHACCRKLLWAPSCVQGCQPQMMQMPPSGNNQQLTSAAPAVQVALAVPTNHACPWLLQASRPPLSSSGHLSSVCLRPESAGDCAVAFVCVLLRCPVWRGSPPLGCPLSAAVLTVDLSLVLR